MSLEWSFFKFLLSALEMSNPTGKNQHGIKRCMAQHILVYGWHSTLHFRPPRQQAAGCIHTIQLREEQGWSQCKWAAGKIKQAVSWAQHTVCVPYTLPTAVLMISYWLTIQIKLNWCATDTWSITLGILSTLIMPCTKPSALYSWKSTDISSSLSSLTLATLAFRSWCCWHHQLLLYFWNVRWYGSQPCHVPDNRLFWKWRSLSKFSNCSLMRCLTCGLPWSLLLLGQHQNPTLWIMCGLYKGTQQF